MFKLKPIITRREEKIIVKYIKCIDDLKKAYTAELKKMKPGTPLGNQYPVNTISNEIHAKINNLLDILNSIYLDK